MPKTLRGAPTKPQDADCEKSYLILRYAHDSARSMLESFDEVRRARRRRGATTDEEQDLLRAMIVFAGAGLDSMLKNLIQDTLPAILYRSKQARDELKKFVERSITRKDPVDATFLANALVSSTPFRAIVNQLTVYLTDHSLQSVEKLIESVKHLGLPETLITAKKTEIKRIFDARNKMIHEMDINFNHPSRNRTPHKRDNIIADANQLLDLAGEILQAVDNLMLKEENDQEI